MIVLYSAKYHIDIGSHVFPTRKYHLLHDRIRSSSVNPNLVEPQAAHWEQLATVHSAEYLTKLQTGSFDWNELALLEIPWSPEVVEGFRLMTGGTIEAIGGLIEQLGGKVVGVAFIIDLTFLEGRKRLSQYEIHSLIDY